MVDDQEFQDRMRKLRAGDADAAVWLVQHFEPEVRRVIRMRLTDPFLRRLVDSADICQSVLANFFVRVGLGQYELEEPGHLVKLLVTMARNKVINLARDNKKEKVARQATGPVEPLEQAAQTARDTGDDIDCTELLQKARSLLSAEEVQLVEERIAGKSWQEIADARNESAEKCRKQFRRALDRVAEQMGLTEPP